MASKALTSAALLMTFNLLFFTLVNSNYTPSPPANKDNGGATPSPTTPTPSTPSPATPTPATPSPSGQATCPIDTLKLGVCANVLSDLVNIVVGSQANTPCCSLLNGLADLDAAVCLCTAIKANLLGINLNVPISLSLLLNNCGKNAPSGFQCV